MGSEDWPGVELRHLAALAAVAEERSFARAAARLGYTQSAVSQQIAALERAVGARLIERPGGPRPVHATEAGEVLLAHARAITARLRAARADLAALAGGEHGRVRVGTFQSAGARILPELMQRLAEVAPGIEVEVADDFVDERLVDMVVSGRLDLTLTAIPIPHLPLDHRPLLSDPCVLVAPAGSPLARGGVPSLADVVAEPMVTFSTCPFQRWLERGIEAEAGPLRIARRTDENGMLQRLVAMGVGVAVVPLLAVDVRDPAIAVVPLGDQVPLRTVVIAWSRERRLTPAARLVVEVAAAVGAEVESTLEVHQPA